MDINLAYLIMLRCAVVIGASVAIILLSLLLIDVLNYIQGRSDK